MSEGEIYGNKCWSWSSPLIVYETDFSVPDLDSYTAARMHLKHKISL